MNTDEQKPPDFRTSLAESRRDGYSRGRKKKFRKLLVLAAVILFILFFYRDSLRHFVGLADGADSSGGGQLISEGAVGEEELKELNSNMLKGAFSAVEQVLLNSAYGAVDFSSDDEAENADLVVFQANSVVSSNNPAPEEIFLDFRREIAEYIVKTGDTPEEIAHSFGINTYTLLWANNLRENSIIRPGDKLIILPINGVRVKIVKGDTIGSLAKKYKGKEDEILAFNSLDGGDDLKIGDYIIIPGGETVAPVKPAAPKYTAPRYASSAKQANDWLIIPTTGRNWGRTHAYNGVDISNPCGTPIYAAAGGKVILSDGVGWNGGYGKYIKIQHPNGVITLYAHASSLLAGLGEQVAQGQLIAYMGTTGRSTGCHLHFEVRGARNPLAR